MGRVSRARAEVQPRGRLCRAREFPRRLPRFVIKSEPRAAVGARESLQLAACAGPSHATPSPSLPPATGTQGVRCQPGRSGCSTLQLAVNCWESVQQCRQLWNLPDPSPGPSSSQPLDCLSKGRPLDPSYPSPGFPHPTFLGLLCGSWGSLGLPWHGRTWQARPVRAQTPSLG